ncbi:MAG TPA: hypothetical protein VHD56_13340 [Tepidisphaeraceae bacterium]|nr:hypothetical protein [Tepidisphaeraceae bacterium]
MDTQVEQQTAERDVPRWVGVMVAVLLMGSIVGGAGYWIWARLTQPPRSQLVEVQGIPQARAINVAPPTSGIQKVVTGGNQVTYTIRAKECLMVVTRGPNDPQWTLAPRYLKNDLMNPDQTAAMTARFRLTNDPAFAKSLKLTEDQLKQLRAVPASIPMVVNDADKTKLKKAVDQYIATSNPANEQAVVTALNEVAANSLAPTRAAIDQLVKKIQTILTPEQIAPFKT